MKQIHESFLRLFFNEMNDKFWGKWCVLHSYDSLPYYSESDVDMAFSGNNIKALEMLIKKVSDKQGWSIYQKLWYDCQSCFYYVIKKDNKDIFLAIDFLIDNKGIGKYGFKTSVLTNECYNINGLIPIPNHEVAFSYKLIKRIIKMRSLVNDEKYIMEHYKLSNSEKIDKILVNQFGKDGKDIIKKYLKAGKLNFSKKEVDFLISKKRKINLGNVKYFKKLYWEIKRIFNRIIFPCGMVINIPNLPKDELSFFLNLLEKRLNILFRFVKLNNTCSVKINFKGIIGSTLIVCPVKNFESKKAIRYHWLYPAYNSVDIKIPIDFKNIEGIVDNYYKTILQTLLQRNIFKN